MKGLIFGIKRFALHDGPGIRTTIFFKGCLLNCAWCHNPESKSVHSETISKKYLLDENSFCIDQTIGKSYSIDELMEIVMKDNIFYKESGGGITLSGGEPMLQHEFVLEFLKACKAKEINTAVDTSGHTQEGNIIERIAVFTDLFLYDIKVMDGKLHEKLTGINNERILKNLLLLNNLEKKIIIRMPLIAGLNDDESNLKGILNFLKDFTSVAEIHLLPYHHLAKEKYKRLFKIPENNCFKPPDDSVLKYFENQLLLNGYQVRIGG